MRDIDPATPGEVTSCSDPMVDNPSHYNVGGIEVIDILDSHSHLDYCLLNALKYIFRAPFKGRQQDLNKAIWYLQHMKERMDRGETGSSKVPRKVAAL